VAGDLAERVDDDVVIVSADLDNQISLARRATPVFLSIQLPHVS
jgi:hypothetical protein